MESLLHILRNQWLEQTPRRALPANSVGPIVPDDDRPPTLAARLAVFPLLFIPWLILYESVVNLGPPPGAFQTYSICRASSTGRSGRGRNCCTSARTSWLPSCRS